MHDKRLTNLMDQVLFSCLILMSTLFITVKVERSFLDVKLHYIQDSTLELKKEITTIKQTVLSMGILDKEDIKYLSYYEPEDAFIIFKYSTYYDIPIKFLYRQDYLESKLGKYPIGIRDNGIDIGFKQLNAQYLQYYVDKYYIIEEEFDPLNNEHSIQIGCAYLKDLYYTFFENWRLAFQAYNAGPTRVNNLNVPPITKEYAQCILTGYSEDFKYIKNAAKGIK